MFTMKESMKLFLIQRDHSIFIESIQHDYGNGWVEYETYFTTKELLLDNLNEEDLGIYKEEITIAHCLDSEIIFTSIKDLFYYLYDHNLLSL